MPILLEVTCTRESGFDAARVRRLILDFCDVRALFDDTSRLLGRSSVALPWADDRAHAAGMALRPVQQTSIMMLLYWSSGQCGIEHRMPYHPDTPSRSGAGKVPGSPRLEADGRSVRPPTATGPAETHPRGLPVWDLDAAADPDSPFDPDWFRGELVRLLPHLRRFAGSMTKAADRTEDLVQETLLRSWLAQDRFPPGGDLRAWTFAIMRSSFYSARRGVIDGPGIVDASTGRPCVNSVLPIRKGRRPGV
ncbi:sigma factor [Methylobacterium radiotolerans]|uniref:sigma factor n=1 Tax=Methylobacterium radiotolerans TaxID=31998 RepID=UPI001FD886C5|nr:sigma factor [Methylobacterium radiotolerans]